jgi:hypothetical protein
MSNMNPNAVLPKQMGHFITVCFIWVPNQFIASRKSAHRGETLRKAANHRLTRRTSGDNISSTVKIGLQLNIT